ncbi:MAG: hypothetical protein NTU63_01760 [Candidatus Pacearchaeota archaeon]|nr:hypothetical protein [Candidatus Pacearchaeota archaeon]
MNLKKKKLLAARTFGVGLERIAFSNSRLDEIKEAITKQDIRDLQKDGAITIKNIKGRKTNIKKKKKRSTGNIKKKVKTRKRDYMILTRKLRKYVAEVRGKLTKKELEDVRKKIKNKFFRDKNHIKEYFGGNK